MSKNVSKAPPKGKVPDKVTVAVREGDDTALKAAEAMTGPYIRAAIATSAFTRGTIGELELDKIVTAMVESAKRVKQGDMRDVEAILMSQPPNWYRTGVHEPLWRWCALQTRRCCRI